MIEYHLQTGLILDSDNYYNQGDTKQSTINNTNQFSNHIYLNGQTLLEDDFSETILRGQVLETVHSGDFYLEDNVIKFSGLNYNFNRINNLHYDIIPSGKRPFFESNNFNNLLNEFANNTPVSGELIFVNGIKLISGIHYYVHDNIFEWDDENPTSLELGGIIFSMPNLSQLTITGQYDIYNQYFKKGATQAYLNGVKLYQGDDFLETSTLVWLIETGISPEIIFTPKHTETLIFF